MALLKKKAKAPATEIISVRLEQEIADKLKAYAAYLEGTPTYVVSEALKYIFKREPEFEELYSAGRLQNVNKVSSKGKVAGA